MVWRDPAISVTKGQEKLGGLIEGVRKGEGRTGGFIVIEKDNPASDAQVKPTSKFRRQFGTDKT